MTTGYIYLLQEREFIKTGEDVYKIGKTTQDIQKRMQGYPKGSKLVFVMPCTDCHETEKKLLKIFREKYARCKDIGAEYFKGDAKDMVNTICENRERWESREDSDSEPENWVKFLDYQKKIDILTPVQRRDKLYKSLGIY
jgi:hypothetical protein